MKKKTKLTIILEVREPGKGPTRFTNTLKFDECAKAVDVFNQISRAVDEKLETLTRR